MLFDIEGHRIRLTGNQNDHCLTIGGSGSGKSYLLYRMIEENHSKGLYQIIIDSSGSFSDVELQKNHLDVGNSMEIINLSKPGASFTLPFPVDNLSDLAEVCVSIVQEALGIKGFKQTGILRNAVKEALNSAGSISLYDISRIVENEKLIREGNVSKDEIKPYKSLSKRMEKFGKQYSSFTITPESRTLWTDSEKSIILLQLSDYMSGPREQFVEFLLSFLWQRARSRFEGTAPFDVLVLDEFQNITFAKESALDSILREGRKYGIRLHLATQNIGKDDEKRLVLLQVGTLFIFQPVFDEINLANDLLQYDNQKIDWTSTLRALKRGHAVLKGHYRVDDSVRIGSRPILVEIK